MRILLLTILLISLPLQAQNRLLMPQQQAQNRYALVIGNSLYDASKALAQQPNLPNPRNDAHAVAQQLQRFGFHVTLVYDQNRGQMDTSISRFLAQLGPGDVGLFYYAGHGLEINKTNWLVPVQTEITQLTLPDRTFSAQTILRKMESATLGDSLRANGLNLMLLDACRDNPFRSIRLRTGKSGGLGGMEPGTVGSLISFAAAAGEPALDALGDTQHSPYTNALLKYMQQQPGLSIYHLFQKVGLEVKHLSGQQPWLRSSISGGDFCLHLKGCAKQHWQQLMRGGSPTRRQLLAFLDDYPQSEHAATAKVLLDALAGSANLQISTIAAGDVENAAVGGEANLEISHSQSKPDYSAQLRTCAAHLKANRLTRGNSGNALDCYKNVLRQDAGNAQALQGLAAIETAFVKLIEDKLAARDLSTAQTYIQRLQNLNAEHRDLTRLQQALAGSANLQISTIAAGDANSAATGGAGVELGFDTPRNYRETAAGLNLDMVWIKGDCFTIGSPASEDGHQSDEAQKRVCVHQNDGYWMGKTEVTQAQWQAIMGNNPSRFKGANRPVERVSWNDIQDFLNKLKQRTGKDYRLPTEAEWEYAARADTTTPFSTGNCISTHQANYDGNYPYQNCPKGKYREETVEVGTFAANAFGLHDMHGNVWEWTCSAWSSTYNGEEQQCKNHAERRSLRGGSWFYGASTLRSAARSLNTPDGRDNFFGDGFGLRLAREK